MTAAVISGLGGYVPPDVVTNADLTERLDTSDEWIRTRTGISRRHVVAPGTATSDLAVEAGRRALESSGEVGADALVLATTTPDHPCPATAPDVAARLGLGNVAAFDLSAVCSGFVYGLAVSAGLIAGGTARRVLLIGADAFTTLVDPTDRGVAVIFADGAGAVVLRAGHPDEPGAVGPVILGSEGERHHLIRVAAGGSRQPRSSSGPGEGDPYFRMHGRETYRHAVERMSEVSREALARAGWKPSDVDRLAAHQANARILNAVAEELEIPEERRLANIDRVGNTAAASIPLLLAQSAAEGQLTEGMQVLLAAFGGGLAWGAATARWPRLGPVTAPDAV